MQVYGLYCNHSALPLQHEGRHRQCLKEGVSCSITKTGGRELTYGLLFVDPNINDGLFNKKHAILSQNTSPLHREMPDRVYHYQVSLGNVPKP